MAYLPSFSLPVWSTDPLQGCRGQRRTGKRKYRKIVCMEDHAMILSTCTQTIISTIWAVNSIPLKPKGFFPEPICALKESEVISTAK